jgi:hypothetical protein
MLHRKISFLLLILSYSLNAQSLNDFLKISIDNPVGSARFESMGGAFGALGGDLSAINVNPAGSAVFNDNQYEFTLSNSKKSTKSYYYSDTSVKNKNKFSANQGGGVWIFKNYGGGNINKISFGVNAQTNNSYYDNFEIKGKNQFNSIDKFFLNNTNGVTVSDLSVGTNESTSEVYKFLGEYYGFSAQQAFLAYQGYLIDFDDSNNTFYSLARYNNGVDQQYTSDSKGYNNKYNLNIAIQFKEDFYFGLNINTHEVYIENYTRLFESNFDEDSAIKSILFENRLTTYGEGFSFQIGALRKFNKLRIGVSYQSPTWYTLWDETSQYLETESVDLNGLNYRDIVDPRITNLYPKYKLNSPSSITLSSALVIGKIGLLSLDVISKDYSKIKVKPKKEFTDSNNLIKSQLQSTLNFKIGSEIRLNKLSLRAGFNSIESPLTNFTENSTSLAYGFGYDFGNTLINFSHKTLEQSKNHQLFDTGLSDIALLESTKSISSLSIVFKF